MYAVHSVKKELQFTRRRDSNQFKNHCLLNFCDMLNETMKVVLQGQIAHFIILI